MSDICHHLHTTLQRILLAFGNQSKKCHLLANMDFLLTEQALWDTIKCMVIDLWSWYTESHNPEAKRLCIESTRYNEWTLDLPTKVNPGVSHCSTALMNTKLTPPCNLQNHDTILDG